MYQISLLGGLAAFGLSLLAGVVGAFILSVIGSMALFILLYAPAIGPTLGKSIVRASGGKRGTKLAVIASAGFVLGALGWSAAQAVPLLIGGAPMSIALAVLWEPFLWIMTVIAVASLWVFLK